MRRLSVATLALSGAIVVLDQLTKALVRTLVPLHSSRTVIAGLLDITHVQTAGRRSGS